MRSLDHLRRSSEAKDRKKKSVMDGQTDIGPMDQQTDIAGVESHSTQLKSDAGSQNLGRQVGRGIQAPSIPFPIPIHTQRQS